MSKKNEKLPIERPNIKAENPEQYYEFGDEIGRGKFSVVRYAEEKATGTKYAAKIMKLNSDSLKFAVREYDMMTSGKMEHKGLVMLHEAYLVRKYLILIIELVDGKTLLDQMSHRDSLTEDYIASIIQQLCEVLAFLHKNDVLHRDIRPTNMRFVNGREIKLLDYNSSVNFSKKSREVIDVIGVTEFCAPEVLNFEPVVPASDMWSIAILAYILLSGISPFFDEDKDKAVELVKECKWKFDKEAFANISSEAKDFIGDILHQDHYTRMTAKTALNHKWLSKDYESTRKHSVITCQADFTKIDERLYGEEKEVYMEASLVFRTFDEDEYDSPEEDDEEGFF